MKTCSPPRRKDAKNSETKNKMDLKNCFHFSDKCFRIFLNLCVLESLRLIEVF